jgi:hypothetical protein
VSLPARTQVADFAPFAARCLDLDPQSVIRLHGVGSTVRGFVRLPYDVLAGRSIAVDDGADFDVTVGTADFLNWQGATSFEPARRDAEWLMPLPARTGWTRIETVAESEIRGIVRAGALTARAEVDPKRQQALMDATVLTVACEADKAIELRLATVSMLTKLGFLPRGAEVKIDVQTGWIRVAAPLGSTYQERASLSLRLL